MAATHKQRADPFAEPDDDLNISDFKPREESRKPVDLQQLDALGKATGFDRRVTPEPAAQPSASAQTFKPRRYTTGRDVQLNVKVTPDSKRRFHAFADQAQVSLSVLFERLLDAYARDGNRAR